MKYKYLSDGSQVYAGMEAGDISEDQWDELSPEQQEMVRQSPFYEEVREEVRETPTARSRQTSATKDEE